MTDERAVGIVFGTAKSLLLLSFGVSACAHQATGLQLAQDAMATVALPDAPIPHDSQANSAAQAQPPTSKDAPLRGPIGPIPALITTKPLSFHDKWTIYTYQTFGPPALVFPALSAGIRMAIPPKNYPRDWVDGGAAFGRLYGSALATQSAKSTAKFLTGAALHEDPRYLPAAEGSSIGARFFHAIAFTFADRNDSGSRGLAFSNFSSAAAGGFVGMAYLPAGFNNISHAGQRAGSEFLGIAVANISREFAPEWVPIVRKLHIPQIVPPWW
jgi:hypothetical protein